MTNYTGQHSTAHRLASCFVVAVTLLVLGALASPDLQAASAATVSASTGPGFTISMTAPSAAGTFTVSVSDASSDHNFHLTGPGVDQSTGNAFVGHVNWTITFQAGATYTYKCDPHQASMNGSFTVPAAVTGGSGDSGSGPGSGSDPGSGSGSSGPGNGSITAGTGSGSGSNADSGGSHIHRGSSSSHAHGATGAAARTHSTTTTAVAGAGTALAAYDPRAAAGATALPNTGSSPLLIVLLCAAFVCIATGLMLHRLPEFQT
ncbi:MAG: hypothetical protein H7123_05640 [Thermoleophilia bacterium]|nr:hypothetical protein [Thermoleophilia bacterium]